MEQLALRGARGRWRRWGAAVTLGAVAVFGLGATTATAATVPAITGVEWQEVPQTAVQQYDTVSFTATWALPASVAPGDQFRLDLPPELTGTTATFPLYVEKTTDTLGACEVTDRAILCTVDDYVLSHDDVKGWIDFSASADQLTSKTELTWRAGNTGTTWTTPLPHGIVERRLQEEFPASAHKDVIQRFANNDPEKGNLWWFIHLGGEPLKALAGTDTLTFTDTMDARLTVKDATVNGDALPRVQYASRADWGTGGNWHTMQPGVASPAGTATTSHTKNTVTAVISNPVTDGSLSYRIDYITEPPAGVRAGDTFKNDVVLNGAAFASTTAVYQDASGAGAGDQRDGSVAWSKVDPESNALAGSEWTLTGPEGTISVVDNGARDADPAPGALKVTGLAWGTYALAEAKAPKGYVASQQEKTATIAAATPSVELGAIVNEPTRGELIWRKTDETGALLGGSEWELTGPGGATAPVVDNGENDDDPAEGVLRIRQVAWGEYTLTETKAPAGYRIASQARTLSVDPDTLAGSFGDIVNSPLPTAPPTTATTTNPSTGGSTAPGQPTTLPPTHLPSDPVPGTSTQRSTDQEPGGTATTTAVAVPANQGTSTPSGPLALTGATTAGILVLSSGLLVAGGVLMTRRRRHG